LEFGIFEDLKKILMDFKPFYMIQKKSQGFPGSFFVFLKSSGRNREQGRDQKGVQEKMQTNPKIGLQGQELKKVKRN
jgi:hypothetical protein